jgi:hypothetical protein
MIRKNREVQNSDSSVKDLNCAVGFGVMDHASYRYAMMWTLKKINKFSNSSNVDHSKEW